MLTKGIIYTSGVILGSLFSSIIDIRRPLVGASGWRWIKFSDLFQIKFYFNQRETWIDLCHLNIYVHLYCKRGLLSHYNSCCKCNNECWSHEVVLCSYSFPSSCCLYQLWCLANNNVNQCWCWLWCLLVCSSRWCNNRIDARNLCFKKFPSNALGRMPLGKSFNIQYILYSIVYTTIVLAEYYSDINGYKWSKQENSWSHLVDHCNHFNSMEYFLPILFIICSSRRCPRNEHNTSTWSRPWRSWRYTRWYNELNWFSNK